MPDNIYRPLQRLRDQWQRHCEHQFEFENAYDYFVAQFGRSARFLHIGLQKSRRELPQAYAVFAVSGGPGMRVPFTRTDLLGLHAALTHPRLIAGGAYENMKRQIGLAEEDFRAHGYTITAAAPARALRYPIAASR